MVITITIIIPVVIATVTIPLLEGEIVGLAWDAEASNLPCPAGIRRGNAQTRATDSCDRLSNRTVLAKLNSPGHLCCFAYPWDSPKHMGSM